MKNYSHKTLATSLTTLVFLVVGISGVMLYMHWFNANVKELHEILGLVFVGAAVLHVYFNFASMKRYFSNRTFLISSIIVVLATLFFVVPTLGEGKGANPKRVVFDSIFNSNINDVLVVLDVDYKVAKAKLAKKGIELDGYKNIDSISKTNGISPFAIINIIKE